MNMPRTLPLILLLAGLAAAATSGNASPALRSPPKGYTVSSAGDYVERGTPRIQVSVKLGHPARRLSDDVWVYHNFVAEDPRRTDPSCRLLIVFFTDGAVSDLKLVNPAAVEFIASDLATTSHGRFAANADRAPVHPATE